MLHLSYLQKHENIQHDILYTLEKLCIVSKYDEQCWTWILTEEYIYTMKVLFTTNPSSLSLPPAMINCKISKTFIIDVIIALTMY